MRSASRPRLLLLAAVCATLLAGCGSPQSREAKYIAKGKAYAEQENWEKARIEFQNALQTMPNDAQARYLNGLAAEKLGDIRGAGSFYQGALDGDKDYVDARFRLARLMLLTGTPDKALEVLAPGLEKHPDDPRLLTIRAACRNRGNDREAALADGERAYKLAPDSEDTIAVLAGLYQSAGRSDDMIAILKAGVARVPTSISLRQTLAQAYLQNRQPGEAEQVLKDIVQLQPTQSVHALQLADYYVASGKFDEAEGTLRETIQRNPTEARLKLALVQLLAQHRGPDAAETELKAQIAQYPKLLDLQFALAQFYVELRQAAKAEEVLNAIIKEGSHSQSGVAAKNSLAALKVNTGEIPAADKLIAEVLQSNPHDNQALMLRADLELARGDPKGAIADLRAVLRDQPTSAPVIRTLARAHSANGEVAQAEETLRRGIDSNKGDTGIRLDLMDLLARTGKLDQARPIGEDLLKLDGGNPNVIEAVFRVQLAQHDYAAALATAAQSSAKLPRLGQGEYLTGLALEAQGKTTEALTSYSAAVDKNPAAEDPLNAYARLCVAGKKSDVLKARLQKITTEQPKLARAWHLLGELELSANDLAAAGHDFEKSIEVAPQRLASYRGLAIVKTRSGDPDAAIALLQSAAAKVTQPEEAQLALGITYQQLGRSADAEKTFDAILAKNPKSEVAANNLAMLLAEQTDRASLDRAKMLVQPFVNSKNPRFADTYGWVLAANGDYAKAIAVLSWLVEQQPSVPTYRYHLGYAQIKSGQIEAGRANLEQALRAGDQFDGGSAAKSLLASVGKT